MQLMAGSAGGAGPQPLCRPCHAGIAHHEHRRAAPMVSAPSLLPLNPERLAAALLRALLEKELSRAGLLCTSRGVFHALLADIYLDFTPGLLISSLTPAAVTSIQIRAPSPLAVLTWHQLCQENWEEITSPCQALGPHCSAPEHVKCTKKHEPGAGGITAW